MTSRLMLPKLSRMARVLCAALALGVICLLLMADPGRAQTLPGLGGGGTGTSGSNADSGSDNLASALRQAAEAGVSVVVLDPGY